MTQHEDQNELTPDEKRLYASLPRHRVPPSSLEERTMNKLRNQGLIAPNNTWKQWPAVAAAVGLLLLGGVSGYVLRPSNGVERMQNHMPKYILLLHESPNPAEDSQAMIEEYGNWARSIQGEVQYVSGEKLKMSGRILTKKVKLEITDGMLTNQTMNLGGFFVIQAKDYESAARIASECPHLKYGGVIELREIDPT